MSQHLELMENALFIVEDFFFLIFSFSFLNNHTRGFQNFREIRIF